MTEEAQESPYAWEPQPGPQSDAIAAAAICEELFFGGAVFAGKTYFLLGDFSEGIHQGENWVGALFRKTGPELDDIIAKSRRIYPYLGGEFIVGQKTWRFDTGAELRMRHMENEGDFEKYMGWDLAWIGWDELPNWTTLKPYKSMISRLRGAAKNKRIRATGNPGGTCHIEIKEYFRINEHPKGYDMYRDPESKMGRMFIPGRVTDNVKGLADDPDYLDRLKGIGDPELIRAWRDGDWDAVIGSYFSMYRRLDVEVEPFKIPEGWSLFVCMDYGEENPTWAGLLAVDYDDDVWVIDEYFRAGAGGMEHAIGIRSMVQQCPFTQEVEGSTGRGRKPKLYLAPADMWTKRKPGEASQALAPKDSFERQHMHLTLANMARVNGWRNLKDLLYAKRLNFFRGRTENILSSLGSMQRDPHDAEDVLKAGNDHPGDGLRIGINHVYKPRKLITEDTSIGTAAHLMDTINALGAKKRRYD
jgi:hypothetical protein